MIAPNVFIQSLLDNKELTGAEILEKFNEYSFKHKDVIYSEKLYELCIDPRILGVVYIKIKGVSFLLPEELSFLNNLNSSLANRQLFAYEIDLTSNILTESQLDSIKDKIDYSLFQSLSIGYLGKPIKLNTKHLKDVITKDEYALLLSLGCDIKLIANPNIFLKSVFDKPTYYIELLNNSDLEFDLFLRDFLINTTDSSFLKNWSSIFNSYLNELNSIELIKKKELTIRGIDFDDEELIYLNHKEFN